jgi:hypothetical protein
MCFVSDLHFPPSSRSPLICLKTKTGIDDVIKGGFLPLWLERQEFHFETNWNVRTVEGVRTGEPITFICILL